MRLFGREKRRIELGNGTVVDKFDIKKDCIWCGRRLNKDYRYSEGHEFNGTIEELVKNYNADLNDYSYYTIDGCRRIFVEWHFHGRCANAEHGKVVAPIDDF